MKKAMMWAILLSILALLAGCGGGGGGSAAGGTDAGIGLPSEVSAIPPQEAAAGPSKASPPASGRSLSKALRTLSTLADTLPADSDYKTIATSRYVDERSLEVFGIIETIFKAINQTHYAEPGNVGTGPYTSVVAWYEEMNGNSGKTLENWTVRSDIETIGGESVNVLRAWIEEPGRPEPIRAIVKIYQAPNQAPDGTYLDYGKWIIQASPGGGANNFYAEADIIGGVPTLRISEDSYELQNFDVANVLLHSQKKGIMHKSPDSGYGKVIQGNWEECWQGIQDISNSPCLAGAELVNGIYRYDLSTQNIAYAYNNDYLSLDVDGTQLFKQRGNPAEIPYQYGIFDATTGQDLRKAKTFGFPIKFDDGSRGYYGSWQGRHSIWTNGGGFVANGTECSKETWGNQAPGTAYTVKSYEGTLVKRTLVDATLAQIAGIPLEIWLGKSYFLQYDGSQWVENRWNPMGNGGMGDMESTPFTQLSSLAWDPTGMKQVGINRWDGVQPVDYRYMEGAFVSVSDQSVYTPQAGDTLNVWISGRTYIVYTGTAWEEKDLLSFDQTNWVPVFGPDNKGPFELPLGQEYYVNNKGLNYVVKHTQNTGTDAADYSVKAEIQTVATPANAGGFLAGVSYLAVPWENPATRSTYSLQTDPELPLYMLLVYKTVGSGDAGKSVGDVVTKGQWGLSAYDAYDGQVIDGTATPIQFNWEFAGEGNNWARATYLAKISDGQIQYLDDPVTFDPVTIGDMSYTLSYDGWLHGLPDMRWELQKNNYVLTAQLKDKIVSIPAGTILTQAGTGTLYLLKPLEVGVVLFTLDSAPEGAPDLTPTQALDLDAFDPPVFSAAEVGPKPSNTAVRYVEGISVE